MTTELKTLQDFDVCLDMNKEEDWIKIKDLKAEAVKWVKEKYHLKYTIGCGFYGDLGWIEFFNFFNLTEEDLK